MVTPINAIMVPLIGWSPFRIWIGNQPVMDSTNHPPWRCRPPGHTPPSTPFDVLHPLHAPVSFWKWQDSSTTTTTMTHRTLFRVSPDELPHAGTMAKWPSRAGAR